MNQPVILAEKPNQAQAYAAVFKGAKKKDGYIEIPNCGMFPNGAKITWAIGHLIELKNPHEYSGREELKKWSLNTLPIVPENFNFEFKPKEDTLERFKVVKKLLLESTEIILACDSDKEGVNIAYSIIKMAGAMNKPKKQLWINSMEEDEVLRGFKELEDAEKYYSLYESALARQISDWLIGINLTRLITIMMSEKGISNKKSVFSVGRVQSPTLKLIYDREQEINNFKPENFYTLETTFEHESRAYKGKFNNRFNTNQQASDFLKKHGITGTHVKGTVKSVVKKIKKEKSPQLHSLSSLQTTMNKRFKYSPSEVLQALQKLYDTPLNLITYPRTDTRYITDNEFKYLKENFLQYQSINEFFFEPFNKEPNKRFVDGSQVQEHYALLPTRKIPTKDTLNKLDEIQQNIYFEIINTTLAMFHKPYEYEETNIKTEVNGIEFETKGKVEKDLGWKELFPSLNTKDEELLPDLKEGDICKGEIAIKEGKTTPKKRYSQGDLIDMMRYCGKNAESLSEEEHEILEEVEGLGTAATRSSIIENLMNQEYIQSKKNLVYVTKKGEILCKVLEGSLLSKPDLTAKWEVYLKQISEKKGKKDIFINSTVHFVKDFINSSKETFQKTDIESQIESLSSVEHIAICPTCKKGHIVDKKVFYGCTEYKNGCKQSFPKKISEKALTKTNIKNLCEKGKTNKIKGFKKKNTDKKFDACLELVEGKLKFSF